MSVARHPTVPPGRLHGWWADPFRRWLTIVLAVVGAAILCREYGHLLTGLMAETRSAPAVSAGTGGTGPALEIPETVTMPLFGPVRLAALSLPALAVFLGLVDGFNPCAMWALVYLISLITGLHDRRKIWFLVGSFVAASGVLYFLFMTAWLNFFLVIGYLRLLTIGIGLFAVGAGLNSIREFVTSRGPLACPVGDAAAKQRTMGRMAAIVRAPLSVASVLAIVALAFTVNTIEFACSAGLPTIFTHTLALRGLSATRYYAYILLYDFFFMLDDLIIFGLAALALDTSVGNRYARQCKLVGGGVLVALGLLMLLAPETLR